MSFQRTCPNCGQPSLKVKECRKVNNLAAYRYRRVCSECGHKQTTYEVTSELIEEYKLLQRLNTAISQVLKPEGRESCTSCTYWSHGSCSMQFPEAGGPFARDCSLFTKDQHKEVCAVR